MTAAPSSKSVLEMVNCFLQAAQKAQKAQEAGFPGRTKVKEELKEEAKQEVEKEAE